VKINPWARKAQGGDFNDIETQIVTHDHALVTVTYTPGEPGENDPSLPSGTWAEYSIEESAEIMTLPAEAMKWEGSDTPVTADVHPGILIPQTVHVVTWHSVTDPPWGHISTLKGKVNENAWQVPATGHYMYPETLLFMGATAEKSFDIANSKRTWSLTYRFWEKSIKAIGQGAGAAYDTATPSPSLKVYGWNHAWDPDPLLATWDKPISNASDETLYQVGDLSDLFTLQAGYN